MSIVAITENLKVDHVNRQMLVLIKHIASPLLFSGFATILLIVLFLGFHQSLSTAERVLPFPPSADGRYVKKEITLCLIVCLLLSYQFAQLNWTILEVFLWFGIFLGPVGVTGIHLYCAARPAIACCAWLYPLIGVVASLLLSFFLEHSLAVCIGTGMTGVLHGATAAFKR